MKAITAESKILVPLEGRLILKTIESVGKLYFSHGEKPTVDSCFYFVGMLIKNGHETMLENYSFSVKFVCDKGISHELLHHRSASFAQDATRGDNYSRDKIPKEVTVILPSWFSPEGKQSILGKSFRWTSPIGKICECLDEEVWLHSMVDSERRYLQLLDSGWGLEKARSVLPHSLKTEVIVTMNLRQWREFFRRETSKTAHPQMRELTIPLLQRLQTEIPVVFDDIQS